MPLIEELPVTSNARTSHGWAYVPDTGRDPAKIALQTGTRKRGTIRDAAGGRDNISAKQQKAVQARLAELEKENYKDTTIPVPPKPKESRGARPKQTPNVKRIIGYQRNFGHYLADEEAQIAQSGSASATQAAPSLQRSSSSRMTSQRPGNASNKMGPPPLPRSGPTSASLPTAKQDASSAVSRSIQSHTPFTTDSPGGTVELLPTTPFDENPLLKSYSLRSLSLPLGQKIRRWGGLL
ncbi:MAG: hypothetical protein Q9227_004967 [Pyrenula ochraceoflavens]